MPKRDLGIWLGLIFMSEQHFDRNTSWERVSSTAVPIVLDFSTQFAAEERSYLQGYHCGFCDESMIATKHGLAPVSQLSVGTPILTRDHGYQPLAGLLRCPDRPANRGFKTVLIRKGALGCNRFLRISGSRRRSDSRSGWCAVSNEPGLYICRSIRKP